MKISSAKSNDNKLSFELEGVESGFANALRRYGMIKVTTLVIDSVVFYDNNTSMFDEYLAHRMGLIPITTPDKLPKEAEITMTIDETGPKNVQSKDLKSSDKEIVSGREEIPIVTLKEGQNIRLEAKVIAGTGKKHAKFQSGLLSYSAQDEKFKFKVESFYQMTPKELVLRACDVMEQEVEELSKALKKIKK